ncbi:MAG: DUF1667 domain-containing protein [Deltaproteobacteria bacterium]|nr:DUF1667 domain-containing protein [Deltaproteobacteria bacterium]
MDKKKKKFTCIICPKSCELETDGTEVSGAKCKRGKLFALQEFVSPLRVITTTIRYENKNNFKMVPVKTSRPVPLNKTFEIIRQIKKIRLQKIPDIGEKIPLKNLSEKTELIVTGE